MQNQNIWYSLFAIVLIIVVGALVIYSSYGPGYGAALVQAPQSQVSPPVGIEQPVSGGSSAKTFNVAISNFAFETPTLTVSAGDTVVWTNMDSVPHTVTSLSGTELSSGTIAPGATYSHTFLTSGIYTYHCMFHPMMASATIIVQ